MAKLFHSDPNAGCAFNGRPIRPGADGTFDVPEEAVAALIPHGFNVRRPGRVAPPAETIPAEDAKRMIERIHELEGLLETERARVKELEAQLEQATAPAAPEAPVAPAADPKPKASKPKA